MTSPPDLFIVHHTYLRSRSDTRGNDFPEPKILPCCRCPVTGEEGRRLVVERYRVRSSSGELLLWLVEWNAAAAETGKRACIIAIAR